MSRAALVCSASQVAFLARNPRREASKRTRKKYPEYTIQLGLFQACCHLAPLLVGPSKTAIRLPAKAASRALHGLCRQSKSMDDKLKLPTD